MSGGKVRERFAALPLQTKCFGMFNILLSLLCVVLALCLTVLTGSLETITAAERFGGNSELRFAQIACYFPAGEGKSEEDITTLRQNLDAKLVEQSLEASEGGTLSIDTYYTRTGVTVSSDHASAQVNAFAVGGDFFYFHPLTLRSGAYIAERDLMDDLVVLDEVLAWRLFGGVELAGLSLTINGKPFVVAGVVAMEDDFATSRAQTEEGTMFFSYSALARLESETSISAYEIVMPDPISGYALSTMEELLSTETGIVVENSGRFSLTRLVELIGAFGTRSMRTGAVAFPYWENALRLAEDYAVLLLALLALAALCPVVSLVVLMVRRGIAMVRFVRREVPQRIDATVERHREKGYARAAAKDTEGE